MKHSPYINWAKKHHHATFNLAGSGMPGLSLKQLVTDPSDIFESGSHEDGWQPLMEKIAERYEVEPREVVTVHSATLANHLIYALLLDPGDEVLVEYPVYEPLRTLPGYFHAEARLFSRDSGRDYQPVPAELEQMISRRTKLLVLSDLHNPSGALLDRNILKEIISLAEKHGFHILIDEVYLEFMYPEGERTLAKLSPSIITSRSLTKAYGLDDIRTGWIIAEEELAERVRRLADLFITTMAFPSERLALAALNRADEMLEKALGLLEINLPIVSEFIEEQPALSWVSPETGTVGFVKVARKEVDDLVRLLEEKYDTLVAPGRFFGMTDHFRIGWGMDTETLKEGLSRLGKALDEFS